MNCYLSLSILHIISTLCLTCYNESNAQQKVSLGLTAVSYGYFWTLPLYAGLTLLSLQCRYVRRIVFVLSQRASNLLLQNTMMFSCRTKYDSLQLRISAYIGVSSGNWISTPETWITIEAITATDKIIAPSSTLGRLIDLPANLPISSATFNKFCGWLFS